MARFLDISETWLQDYVNNVKMLHVASLLVN